MEGSGGSSVLMPGSKMSGGEDGTQSYGKAVQMPSRAGRGPCAQPVKHGRAPAPPPLGCELLENSVTHVANTEASAGSSLRPPGIEVAFGTRGIMLIDVGDQRSYQVQTGISVSCDFRSVYLNFIAAGKEALPERVGGEFVR